MLSALALVFLLGPAPAPACDLTLCMAGAFQRTDGANPRLARVCSEAARLVEDCGAAGCAPLFHFAAINAAHAALLKALDANADGVVDAKDPPTRICLVGYSWGGVNASLLAQQLLTDPKIAPERRGIEHLVLIDPFAPMTRTIAVPAGVKHAVNHRHSKVPPGDCSQNAPMGPYLGLPMTCAPGVACTDLDHPGAGHCSIVRRVADRITPLIGRAPPASPTPTRTAAPPR